MLDAFGQPVFGEGGSALRASTLCDFSVRQPADVAAAPIVGVPGLTVGEVTIGRAAAHFSTSRTTLSGHGRVAHVLKWK